jgi:hypothetical protein
MMIAIYDPSKKPIAFRNNAKIAFALRMELGERSDPIRTAVSQ